MRRAQTSIQRAFSMRGEAMATFRVNKEKDFTTISNSVFKEKQMSLKAKGILCLMLSLPEDWDYSVAGLCTLSKDGKDSVMNALSELETFGYLVRTKVFQSNGRFAGYDYDIYEVPRLSKPDTENPKTEKPYAEKPNTENPQQLNTNKSNTKELSTKIIKDIVAYLNEKAGTAYRTNGAATKRLINARLSEGYTLDDFKTVIDKKCAEWQGSDMAKYLRPETLFGSKFESYLNEPVVKRKTYGANGVEIKQSDDDELAGIL